MYVKLEPSKMNRAKCVKMSEFFMRLMPQKRLIRSFRQYDLLCIDTRA